MGYKLELDLPHAGKGVEVYLDGLGVYENPGEYEVTDEQDTTFRTVHQTAGGPGPTVLEYFKDTVGIKVTEVEPADKKPAAKKAVAKKAAAAPSDKDTGPVVGGSAGPADGPADSSGEGGK